LGFLERCDSWILASRFFRSKMGGKPAWLDLQSLPTKSDLCCPKCDLPLTFLCQLYNPISGQANAFHRVLFVFVCRSPSCLQFKVFRSQLPRKNRFYPYEPPVEQAAWKPEITAEKFARICRGCGGQVDGVGGKCGGCKKVDYCHRKCQVTDWKHRHKRECKDGQFDPLSAPDDPEDLQRGFLNGLLFPEYEIVMAGDDESDVSDVSEDDEEDEDDDDDEEEGKEAEMEAFKELEKEGKTGNMSAEELAKYTGDSKSEDKNLRLFKKAIKSAPDQVIRYQRGGQAPLWVSTENLPPGKIPSCDYCGADRKFEFQIMPQMLNYLKLDAGIDQESVDWGTLAIYTCETSCDSSSGSSAYKAEYLWRQPMS